MNYNKNNPLKVATVCSGYTALSLTTYYKRITPVVFPIRKLTPMETGRLMGMRDNEIDKFFKAGISNSNIYKLHGNSIVVDTIFHIYRKLLIETEQDKVKYQQLSLF